MYGIRTPRSAGDVAALPCGGMSALPSEAASVRWAAASGKTVYAARDIAEGETLWTERPAAAWQYLGSRGGAMACRHSLRFVGSLPEQLQIAAGFDEAEEEAGTAAIPARLAVLLQQDRVAAARTSPTFVLNAFEEVFADAAGQADALAGYNWLLQRNQAAWMAFVGHAARSNEAFCLAAQLVASRCGAALTTSEGGAALRCCAVPCCDVPCRAVL